MEPARGFVALISAVIISSILLGVAATLDQGVFFTRFDALNFEYKRISESLADSCIEAGTAKLANNYDYLVEQDPDYDASAGGVPISLGTLYGHATTCLLRAPTTTPPEINQARAYAVEGIGVFTGAVTEKRATVTVTNPHYRTGTSDPLVVPSAWHEIP
jgi:hypothetical protein